MTLPVLRSQNPPAAAAGLDPLHEIAQLQQRMNQLFTTMIGDLSPGTSGTWTPLADVTETDDAYLVEIDMPGVDRKDLTVEVTGTRLHVRGEIVEKEKAGWLRHRTRRVGQFSYQTLLPGDIDADHVKADLADGVLTVSVPKSEAARPRRIPVSG
ncbi:Hsp20/alpha crystallin family protein [Couchioplanes azureus]|uniref:Hsp20/alpha crystallin family protein n=1 Tax=Couchioplanes caeruleus TaxID=56438 RepID=UPI0016703835|nr:Hsp20/alpha crystallin family protein [Couchioplanes caeruleus]GGQ38159.1 heat-shock protein Hsp20 [Couchioplanes caeruleus subsp. azureus]